MKTTRPVFESFNQFVEYLNFPVSDPDFSILEGEISAISTYRFPNKIQEILGKLSDFSEDLGPNFGVFTSEWKKNSQNSGNINIDSAFDGIGIDGATKYTDTYEIRLGEKLKDKGKYVLPISYETTVKQFEFKNARGKKVPILANEKIVLSDSNSICSIFNIDAYYKMLMYTSDRAYRNKSFDYDYLMEETKNNEDKKLIKSEELYWKPGIHERIFDTLTPFMSGGENSISIDRGIPRLSESGGSLAGGLAKTDSITSVDLLKKENSIAKYVFYTVKSVEIGGGNPYTNIDTKTIQIPVDETKTESSESSVEIKGTNGMFKAGEAVPQPGKESLILESINKAFSAYTNILSVVVQGSASWEWTDGKTRDDAKNTELAGNRAKYFVDLINKSAGKTIATLANPSGVVQPKDKESESKENWRKITLTIKGTKDNTVTVTKIVNVEEDQPVTLNYDKVIFNEYVVTITTKSPGKIAKNK